MNTSTNKDKLPGKEDVQFILSSVRDWSEHMLQPAFRNGLPDGDRALLKKAIEALYDLGVIFHPDPSSAGYELGVWGAFTGAMGPQYSLRILNEIAKTCASVAFLVHQQGIASASLLSWEKGADEDLRRISFAFQDAGGMPAARILFDQEGASWEAFETRAQRIAGGYELRGRKNFVYGQKESRALVVPARLEEQWALFFVPMNAEGLRSRDAGRRTGLRYLQLEHVELGKVRLKRDALIAGGEAARAIFVRTLTRNLLGMAAIAKGIAEGSMEAAGQYVQERYQGGTRIKNHAAIRSLLSNAYSKVEMAGDLIERAAQMHSGKDQLREAARLKLIVLDECSRVVSDMMQVFGGYGYMQEFRIEKRLRDIQVLKLNAGSPLYLNKFIYDLKEDSL